MDCVYKVELKVDGTVDGQMHFATEDLAGRSTDALLMMLPEEVIKKVKVTRQKIYVFTDEFEVANFVAESLSGEEASE